MASLLRNGQQFCDLTNVAIREGQRKYTRVSIGEGRSELVPGVKDPDEVTFSVPFIIDISNTYSLKLDDGTVLDIMIDQISNRSVHAFIQGT